MSFYPALIQGYHLQPGTTLGDDVIVAITGYDEPLVDNYQYSSTLLVHFTRLAPYQGNDIPEVGERLAQWIAGDRVLTIRGRPFHVELNVIHDDYNDTIPHAELLRDNILRLYVVGTILRE